MKNIDLCKLKSNIHNHALSNVQDANMFGASYLVSQFGKVVYKEHFGYMTPDNTTPVTDDTIYRLASMTKPITAVGVLILVDRGLLSLEDSVSKYVPEIKDIHIIDETGCDLGVAKNDMKIFHLLSHTSGFGGCSPLAYTKDDKKNVDTSVDFFIRRGLAYEPNTKQAYSATAAFDLLVKIIMKLTGENYEDFLKREIFDHCMMTDTTFIPTEKQWKRMIGMHDKQNDNNVLADMIPGCVFGDFPPEHMLGGAGLISTLDDYYKFTMLLLNKGIVNGKRIVSEEMIDKMSSPWVGEDIMPGERKWGLGVRVISDKSYKLLPVGSFGWSGAYGCHFWIDPVNNITAVFMRNSKVDGGSGSMVAKMFEKAVFDALK